MKNSNRKPNKQRITLLVIICLLVVILIGLLVFAHKLANYEPEETIPPVTEPATEPPTEPPTETEPVETTPEPTEPQMLPFMAELYEKNKDVAGWVRIDDTKIDYPYVYTPDEYDKYLYMNLDGKHSYAGSIIMDQRCTVEPESSNIILHGHNMKNGSMFAGITKYEKKSYWEKHPTIYFTTLYEEREYEIIAAFKDKVHAKSYDGFKFYEFANPETEEEFNEGMKFIKKKALYDTKLTAEYGDRLLMLVTCAYHVDNGRFVLVAREIVDDAEEVPTGEEIVTPTE